MIKTTSWADLPPTLSIKEAAAFLRMAPNTMAEQTRRPDFPCRRFGRKVVISTEGLRRYLARETGGEAS